MDWKPDFESASVLPYYSDDQERTWVLLSKKSYKDREYGEPSWGDFGGTVEEGESAVSGAVRELAEETEEQITTTEPELLGGSFHQIDMKNSPFGDGGLRRHTLFFKKMREKVMLKVALDLERGPTADGSHEVSMYQWILAKDLLNMQIPAIFGRILEPLKYSSDRTRNECFSVPFFVLLQQNSIRKILLQHKQSQDFSQISFTKLGFQDWRLIHSGLLGIGKNPKEERRQLQQILEFDPEASGLSSPPAPIAQLRLFHKPTSDDTAIKFYPFNVGSPNFWRISMSEGESKTEVEQLMQTYEHRSAMLKELKERNTAAEVTQPHPFPWAGLKPMTDAQLESLGVPAEKLQDTKALLEVYQTKVKQMRAYTKQVDSITCDSFVEAVQKVLEEERAHPEMFVAYHGCAAEIHFLNTVYKVLREKLGLPEKTVDWRLFDSALGRYRGVRDAFVDSAQSAWQKQGFLNPFDIFVSANAALTGNPEHDGCRTLTYWKNSYSEVRFDLKHMLDDVLKGIGLEPAQIDTLKTQLYDAYKQSYYVESPEPTAEQAKEKRPVGVLRQAFLDPEYVQDQLALSGWYFDHPITFDDRILPDGTKLSIYDDLEEGDNAWMKNLPSALRYMVHIRAGHSTQLEETIETYNKSNADGLRPFGLFDYEVRLFTGANPAMVKTHYYPPSPEDSGREEKVKRLAYEFIGNHLQGSELPIRSFYDFHKTYEFLRTIIKNQLGIRVPPAPVSLDQFKGAVAQGDLQTMEVYLDDPSVHKIRFEDVDIITGESRLFTLADYMTMVAMRHDMVADTIETAVNKYNILIENNVHPTETPFALQELLLRSGLNDLQKWIGWNGDLDTRIRFANDKEKGAILKLDVPKETQFSGEIFDLTIEAFIQIPKTQELAEFIQTVGSKTEYSTLFPAFWKNLAATENVDIFFKSMTTA